MRGKALNDWRNDDVTGGKGTLMIHEGRSDTNDTGTLVSLKA
jgi:hypothetical protein